MTSSEKNNLYKKFGQVSVNTMIISEGAKCCECKDKVQEFSIFIGEGQRLSTLHTSCCRDCLPLVILEATKIGMKDYEEAVSVRENVKKYNL
jgi:2-methylaconitate cis-trans-isomerase PrpF